jgi:uncharacterized protein
MHSVSNIIRKSLGRVPRRLLAGTLVATALVSGGGAAAQQIGIGTMGQGTSGYSMGAAIARVLSENGYPSLAQPSSGTSAYLPLINMGELDMGIANAIEIADAVNGEGDFEGRPLDQIAPAARLFPFRVGIFVRDDSGIETVADLAGKAVTYGFTSQVTINRVVNAILAAGGIAADAIEPVMVPNVVRGADDLASGRADGAFFAIGSGKVSEVDATVGGVHFLPLPDTEDAEARLKEIVPQAYIETIEPAASIAGIDEPTPVMSYDYYLVVGRHMSDEDVGKIVGILRDNKDELVGSFASFAAMDTDAMHVDGGVPYHPGAESVLNSGN